MTHCLSAVSRPFFHGCSWMHSWRVSCRRHFQRTSFVSVGILMSFSAQHPASTNCNATSPYIPLWVKTSSWRLSKLLSTERKVGPWFFEVSRDTWSPSCRDSRGSCRFFPQTFGTPKVGKHSSWCGRSFSPNLEKIFQSPLSWSGASCSISLRFKGKKPQWKRLRHLRMYLRHIPSQLMVTEILAPDMVDKYPIFYRIIYTSQVVIAGLINHQQYDKGSHLGSANWPSSFGGWF